MDKSMTIRIYKQQMMMKQHEIKYHHNLIKNVKRFILNIYLVWNFFTNQKLLVYNVELKLSEEIKIFISEIVNHM